MDLDKIQVIVQLVLSYQWVSAQVLLIRFQREWVLLKQIIISINYERMNNALAGIGCEVLSLGSALIESEATDKMRSR